MKVILLLVAVYALIINQALKQADSKAEMRVKKEKRTVQSPGDTYVNNVYKENNPTLETERRHLHQAAELPASYMYPVENMPGELKPRNLLFPINYPYQASADKRRS